MIRIAVEQDRILLTEDKDFGQLVFAQTRRSAGVILVRYPTKHRKDLPAAMVDFIKRSGASLGDRFAVFTPGRVRIASHPTTPPD